MKHNPGTHSNADTARFLNQDPFEGMVDTPPSLHRYLYAYANSTVWVDLTGYSNVLLPHELDAMKEAADSSLAIPAELA
jgi:hypothetical protein